MIRIAVLCVILAACRDAGTIEIDLTDALATCEKGTMVSAELILEGECSRCNGCADCDTCEPEDGCIRECELGCNIEDLGDRGIAFDSPSPGSYAAIVRYTNDDNEILAVVCSKITVDADGTQSTTRGPDKATCCAP